jgi:ribosomal-protein-alanine N-acetyltransferase
MSAVIRLPQVHLRAMTRDDLERVMDIEVSAYQYPWTLRIFSDCLRVGYQCRVVEIDGQLAGYGIMSTGAGEAHILNLCVGREYQGQGVGRKLLLHLLERARELEVDTVFLEVRPSNTPAMRLYENLGFNRVGTRKDYYPAENGREDAAILALTLSFPSSD